jgi:hypothetical protein
VDSQSLKPSARYSLSPLEHEGGRSASWLVSRGVRTDTVVPGCDLEAQLETDAGVLLFTTHDTPFEEILEIVLISPEGALTDNASIFWPSTTGTFQNLRVIGPSQVQFDFFGTRPWSVTVYNRPRLRLPVPFLSEPLGVHRPCGFTRRFFVERR